MKAERRFWRKEFHGNVDYLNASLGSDHGSFKVDKESRYERINVADLAYADDFLAENEETVSNGMPDDVRNKIASLFI